MIKSLSKVGVHEGANSMITETFQSIPCYICLKIDVRRIATVGHFGLPTNVSLCRGCGLVYLTPRWTRERYFQFYATEYDRLWRPESVEIELRGLLQTALDRIEGLAGNSFQSVLDIGAGSGLMLELARTRFNTSRLSAVEPSIESQNKLTGRGIRIIGQDVDESWAVESGERFDLILMRHVLEHLMDPVAVLRKVRSLLAPNSTIYLAVPNMLKPGMPLRDNCFTVVHTYYFSPITLRRTLALAGLELASELTEWGTEMYAMVRRAQVIATVAPGPSVYREQLHVLRRCAALDLIRPWARPLWRGLRRLASNFSRR